MGSDRFGRMPERRRRRLRRRTAYGKGRIGMQLASGMVAWEGRLGSAGSSGREGFARVECGGQEWNGMGRHEKG